MKNGIEAFSKPDKEQISDMLRLQEAGNSHDGTGYTADFEDDFRKEGEKNSFLFYRDGRLVSMINLFAPGKEEGEITAVTHSDFRRQGCFRRLLEETRRELKRRAIPSLLFVCDRASESGTAVMAHLGAPYEFSEYLMRYEAEPDLSAAEMPEIEFAPSVKEEQPELVPIMQEAFDLSAAEASRRADEFFQSSKRAFYTIRLSGKIAGMIGVYEEAERDYIHSFCMGKQFRGRGAGKAALIKTVNLCRSGRPGRELHLEVQTGNENALSLYKKAGFRTITVFDYYRR
jgi:ribosomal protein S18 acetylase RimI-like enzyme